MHQHSGNAIADHRHAFESPEQVAQAELEAEVLAGLTAQAADALADRAEHNGVQVRRLLDLGSGPGVGTCHLAERFPDAQIVAVDGSTAMLERVNARAERLGLAPRVLTARTDLHTGLGGLGRADVVWSSMALHHISDEANAVRQIGELLEPGGLLAVLEHAGPVHLLPASAEQARPGLGERLDVAWAGWFAAMRASLPDSTPSGSYPQMLEAAGFEVLVDQVLELTLDVPLDGPARRFAHRHLAGVRNRLGSVVDAADLAVLDTLVDEHHPDGILHPGDVPLRTSRQLYIARTAPSLSAGATPPVDRTRSDPGRP